MKRLISLILIAVISISGCQQNLEESKSEDQISESKELKFSEIAYNKVPENMATSINEKAKKLLEDTNLGYDEYAKLEYAGEIYLVKGSRREITLEEYKNIYSNSPIPESIGEYKVKTITVGSTMSSPYYLTATQEEKSQIASEGIDKEKYKITKQQSPIMEILYEKENEGLSITIQNKELLNLAQKEDQDSIYWYMAIPQLEENEFKESEADNGLKIYYDEKANNFKSMGIYENTNEPNIIIKVAFGQLDKVNSYGVDYMALGIEESSNIDPSIIDILDVVKDIKLP